MIKRKKYCSKLQEYGCRIIRDAIKNNKFGSSPEDFPHNQWKWINEQNERSNKYYWFTHDYQIIVEGKHGLCGLEFLGNFRIGYTYVAYIEFEKVTIPNIFNPDMSIEEVVSIENAHIKKLEQEKQEEEYQLYLKLKEKYEK